MMVINYYLLLSGLSIVLSHLPVLITNLGNNTLILVKEIYVSFVCISKIWLYI